MKHLKILIIIVFIIVIIIASLILFLSRNNSDLLNNSTGSVSEIEIIEEDYNENSIERFEYNAVNSAINLYLQSLNLKNSSYYRIGENEQLESVISDKEKKQNVYDLLSDKYIDSNNITVDNLDKKINMLEQQLIYVPLQMKKINDSNLKSYVINGITENLDNEFVFEICLIVNIDYDNTTFSIEPTNEKYEEIQSLSEISSIEKNDNNQYKIGKINVENISKDYMNIYKRLALTRPDLLYYYFDEEYREKRFENVDNFEEYVENNKEEISKIVFEEYLVNTYEDYTEYVCKDQYENLYIFKEIAPTEFTIELDTYTLPNEKFTTTYESANIQKKVMMNIDKWIQMINNRDYKAAYDVLDETFRENNFGSAEKFEEYMRKNLPLHYEVEFDKFTDQGQVYVQEIILTDITDEDKNIIKKSIIMKLEEDTEFVMSFNT